MSKLTFFIVMSGVFLNALAQLLLKSGTNSLGVLFPDGVPYTKEFIRISFEPYIVAGLFCYVLSVALWIAALSKAPVSVAYPMLSIGYIVNAIAAHYLLGENLTIQKLIGIVVIVVGVYFVAKS
jgi:drug/metabolite transporter (DMT)-like permease